MKRVRPAPMGRAYRYQRRMAHIVIKVAEKGKRRIDGTESSSVRIPAGLQQAVALALVRQAGLRQAAAGRPGAEGDAARAAEVGRRQLDRSGPPGQQAAGHHPHFAARHHHRPQGRGDREAEAGPGQAHQARGLHRHSGSAQAGAGCATGFGIDRAAARKARGLPPRHAQGGGFGAALRLQGHQGARVGPAERRRNRAQRMVSAGPASAAHAARRYRLRFRRGAHHLRRDRHQGVALQGRDSG